MEETKDGKFGIAFGVPTEPDVKALREKFGVPKDGDVVKYADAAKLLNLDKDSPRFKTVTTAWRRQLYKEHNVVLDAVRNEGWKCLPPNDRIHFSKAKYGSGLRRVWRASEVAETTSRESLGAGEKKVCDHLRRCAAAIRLAVVTSRKPIDLPDPEIKK